MKIIIYYLLFISFLLLFQNKSEALTISPYSVSIETDAGNSGTSSVRIINDGSGNFEIKAYALDIGFDKSGKKIFRPVGGFDYSVAKFVKISPERFNLKDNEAKEVKISVSMPHDSIGGKQAMVYFEASPVLPGNIQKKSARISLAMRLGVLVLHETKGTVNVKSRIKNVNVLPISETEPLSLDLEVTNEGNTHILASGVAAIMKDDYTFIGKIDFNKSIVFPNRTKTLRGEWNGNLSPGQYHAIITYQYGEDKNVVIDKVFEIKPRFVRK